MKVSIVLQQETFTVSKVSLPNFYNNWKLKKESSKKPENFFFVTE